MNSNKLTFCKTCGAEVAKSAKTCPHCGAKVKKGNPILIGILVFFLIVGIIGSSGGGDTNKSSGRDRFFVGETADVKGVNVTLVDVTESRGSLYNKPTDGNIFVLFEFEIANNSNSEITVSSIMSFEAYCDDYACTYSLGALMEKGNKNQLDGTVAAGKKFNGVIGYEVPSDWYELEVAFTPDFWDGKNVTFVAIND